MRFKKRRQREDETIDKFLDDLEMLRRRSQLDESNRRINLAIASKFIDDVKNDELRTMLATHYTPLSTNAPTPEELRLKSKKYLLLKPPSRSGYYKNNYGNFNNGTANQGNNWYKPGNDMDKRRSFANCSSTDQHVSAFTNYKQGMKAIGFSLEDEDASEVDHEDFMRGVITKFGPSCFLCNLEGHFKSDCPQFWDAVADIKHPRHEEALSGVKASKARLLSEEEARGKETPQELATKKMQAVSEETCEPEPVTAADDFKIDYKAAGGSGGSGLLTTGGPRIKKLHGRYVEVYGPYQVMLNVDGISIYTRTYATTDSDQIGQIYMGEEELKVRRIGHEAMMEQDALHIGYEADVTAHLLDTNGKKIGVTGLDTGVVVSVMPIKAWERLVFPREDLIPTNLRLAAAN